MSKVVTVSADYLTFTSCIVDLSPKSWDDVESWHIKWGTLYVLFKGEYEFKAYDLDGESDTDWKRPLGVTVYEGEDEYEHILAETE